MKRVSVTVDIEDWYHVPAISGSHFSVYRDTGEFFRKWEGRYDYLTRPTDVVLDILSEFGITATFFIVAQVTDMYDGLVEEISARGHEIACHGYDHMSYVRSAGEIKGRELFRTKTREAKKILEETTGEEIRGYRAPGGYVTGWMIDELEKIGFEYDSSVSVNSFYNKTDSNLEGVGREPYYPEKGELVKGHPREILEIPWPYFKLGSLKIPAAGGAILRFLGSRFIRRALEQTLQHSPTFFYFHPLDISKERFPIENLGTRPFYWAVKGDLVYRRLRSLLSNLDANYVTMSRLAKLCRKGLRLKNE